MPPPVLIRKVRSAFYHAGEAWKRMESAREAAKKQRAFDLWLNRLRRHPPDVLVGGNFVDFGGCRHHMHALERFSSLTVALAPSDEALTVLSPHHFTVDFRQQFLDFNPKGIRVAHSHVFPWFIEWSQKQRKSGIRWVHTYHLNYFPEHANGDLLPWQKEINDALLNVACHADVRLSVSRWQQSYLLKTHQIKTVYIPNGVDVGLCDQSDAARFRDSTGMTDFILYAGRNDPVKNPADFARLAARLPKLRFLMIGQGLSRDVLEKEWQVDVPPNLTIRGQASHAETLDAIAACSVLVVTSKREGLPTLVMEGMALGKPVVVPDEDGCMEAVGGGEFGFVYRQGDLDHLAALTLEALGDVNRHRKARQRVLEKYDWRVVIKKLDAIYRGEDCR